MWTPIALVVAMLVASAFIARLSDDLGKKLGKKRISVLGLRPRTSASLLTIATSWAIMLVTLLALLITVAPLKSALFSIDKVRRQLSDSRVELAQVRQQVEQDKQQTEVAHEQAARAQEQAKKAQAQAKQFQLASWRYQGDAHKARADANLAQQQQSAANAALSGARRAAQNAQSAEQNAREQQQRALESLRGAQAQLASSKDQLGRTKTNLQQAQQQFKSAQEQEKQAKKQLKAAESDLRSRQLELKTTQRKVVLARSEVARIRDVTLRIGDQALRLGTQVDQLSQQANQLKQYVNSYGAVAENLSSFPIVLSYDQTLAEQPLDPNLPSAHIQKVLRGLLDEAQTSVQEFVPDAQIVLYALKPVSNGKNAPLRAMPLQEILDSTTQVLSLLKEPVSVRLVSASNYTGNDKSILVRFRLVLRNTVYRTQQTIAEKTVDATKTESKIYGQLQDLINMARARAVAQGANPPLSREAPNFFDGDTGAKMFETLRQLQRIGKPVPVRIVAARDLDASEPLQIRFQIGDGTPGAKNTA